jgi:hypothetical protein
MTYLLINFSLFEAQKITKITDTEILTKTSIFRPRFLKIEESWAKDGSLL